MQAGHASHAELSLTKPHARSYSRLLTITHKSPIMSAGKGWDQCQAQTSHWILERALAPRPRQRARPEAAGGSPKSGLLGLERTGTTQGSGGCPLANKLEAIEFEPGIFPESREAPAPGEVTFHGSYMLTAACREPLTRH